MDAFVRRETVEVLRVRADMRGMGPAEAFRALEAKLPTIKGRKFYGTIWMLPEGEEYFACVERRPGELSGALGLGAGTIPGGLYVRRKIFDWERVVAEGKIQAVSENIRQEYSVDPSRPEVEFYRSGREPHLLLPVLSQEARPRP